MEKRTLKLGDCTNDNLIASQDYTQIFQLSDGSILKVFNPMMLEILKLTGVDTEKKVLTSDRLNLPKEIIRPKEAVYDATSTFLGYTMPRANGINFNDYDAALTIPQREDLSAYATTHAKIENIMSQNPHLVFPDICTCDNIFIDKDGNIQVIDFDGIQVEGQKSLDISSALGNPTQYSMNPKYSTEAGLYTKELDKKSSLILYYLSAFNVNLNMVGRFNPSTGKIITVEDFFECLNLDDPDLCHKTWKLFDDKEQNEFLGDTVFDIADRYDMKVAARHNNCYIKRLQRKR